MTEVMCRGSWQLGTACGKCSRCLATKPAPHTDGGDGELVEELLQSVAGGMVTARLLDAAKVRQAAARITALSAEVERLTAFIERLTTDVCACGVMPGVTCLGCQSKAALGAKP